MNTWTVFLRGINVGGHKKLPMAELRTLLTKAGFANVQTYIQSGNCVLESAETDARLIESAIHSAIANEFGYQLPIMALSKSNLANVIKANPYDVAEGQEKTVHIFILSKTASSPDLDKLEVLKAPSEKYTLTGEAFYLHAPDGIGRSKLATGAEKCLGVPVTARNLRSVKKVLSLAETA